MILASRLFIRSRRLIRKEMDILSIGQAVHQVIWISIGHPCLRLLKAFMGDMDRKRV